jgi:hypothetical protein
MDYLDSPPTLSARIAIEYWPFALLVFCWYLPTVSLIYSKTSFSLTEFATAFHRCLDKPIIGVFGLPVLIFMLVPSAVSYLFVTVSETTLKEARFYWNVCLSLLSLFGLCYAFGDLAAHNDLPRIVELDFEHSEYTSGFSCVIGIFSLTKSLEFVDTFFLVSSGKKPSFLHIYHHITVAAYCWIAEIFVIPYGHTFALMNLFVHACMYGYFAMVPSYKFFRCLRPSLTILQIIQMVIGTVIAVNVTTNNHDSSIAHATLAMYGSYLVLFVQFFISQYTCKSTKIKKSL